MKHNIPTKDTSLRLTNAIQELSAKCVSAKTSRSAFKCTPWVGLPDIREFRIKLGNFDPIFTLEGISKKNEPVITTRPYRNKSSNRYIEHQIIRLSKYKSNPRAYWTLALALMKRSNTWRVMAFNHVFPQWHRKLPLKFILNCNRSLSNIINRGLDNVKIQRVYIKKGKDGHRPLGVPSPVWRVYLHMYAAFITFFVQDSLHSQHGYIPGKGTATAWRQIMGDGLYKLPYITEWDFKNYFNEIHSNKISEILLNRYKFPKSVVYFLENVNRSQVDLPDELKLDESLEINKARSQNNFRKGIFDPNDPVYDDLKKMMRVDPILRQEVEMYGGMFEYIQFQWALQDSVSPSKTSTDFNGVAQGAPTSPILANLIMDEWIRLNKEKGYEVVAYADDSITFSKDPISLTPPPGTGITINESKSGIVKSNGIFIKPLKFLGVVFDDEMIYSETRKGKTLEFDERMKKIIHLKESSKFRKFESTLEFIDWLDQAKTSTYKSAAPSATWETYFKSKLWEFAQNRLYNGSWNLDGIEQDFEHKFINSSWMNTKLATKIGKVNLYTSSSFACWSLANMFRWNSKLKKKRSRIRMEIK